MRGFGPSIGLVFDLQAVARWSLLVYGFILVLGGILGYLLPEKPSRASLIAGSLTGAAAIGAFFLAGASPLAGCTFGVLVAAATGAMMFVRLRKTGKFMPAGMVVGVSAVVLLLLLCAAGWSFWIAQ